MLLFIVLAYLVVCSVAKVDYGTLDNQRESIDALVAEYTAANDKSLLWGAYRSNLYLGVKPRLPESLLTGVMWYSVDDYQGIGYLRHECRQEDQLDKFGWTKYDARIGGHEVIKDAQFKTQIDADFVKTESGNWALRVKGKPENPDAKTSVVFYAGLEGEGELQYAGADEIVEKDAKLVGYSERLGGLFEIDVTRGADDQYIKKQKVHEYGLDPSVTRHLSLTIPTGNVWRAKDILLTLIGEKINQLKDKLTVDNKVPPEQLFQMQNMGQFSGNLHFVQKTFQGEFEFDILYNVAETDHLSSDVLPQKIKEMNDRFDKNFIEKFQLLAPFTKPSYFQFAKEMLSQLLGGISYFYGDQLVDRDVVIDDVEFSHAHLQGKSEGPYELFTAVPSRPFFPRGFYWDEGFHLLPILEYDSDLALEIVQSWFSLIDDDGWIAREQILGDEARSKVPPEFTVQNPNIANPPTLMLVFTKLLDLAKQAQATQSHGLRLDDTLDVSQLGNMHLQNPELLVDYANKIYPQLQKHYNWFRNTQRGETSLFDRQCHSTQDVFRWKGRTKDHCLPSGIDDYPRPEADVAELHVDLLAWMGIMTRSMYKIAHLLDKHDDSKQYLDIYNNIVGNLDDLHWSSQDKSYCDVTVDDNDENVFECHIGYVSIMPFVHHLIPASSDHLEHVLAQLHDPEQLWTPYGIRSLSKQDEYFHKGEDYWRGHIWININYLVLESLQYYGTHPETKPEIRKQINTIYTQLRTNLVENIFKNYNETGYLWEQYNENTGAGQRTRHFAGWTSLVVLMMKMPPELDL
ncbi:hypothetical protein OGAPHI_001026 [Ogataea philodendri]|uniref:Mannosyl-oligosaccharide glucosidase n=1 Tax=Ogataea philodendri TaxID=1378263 RepID=A0A9P8PEQ2_9ASCO|nr:uncharacterized protein OGAPHI_001026 [Ogataea philodendri]KAH3670511.1 hypothetical protein OGAPHI_001026 [Ogataea philodendri]